jgi:hypothetical protein
MRKKLHILQKEKFSRKKKFFYFTSIVNRSFQNQIPSKKFLFSYFLIFLFRYFYFFETNRYENFTRKNLIILKIIDKISQK